MCCRVTTDGYYWTLLPNPPTHLSFRLLLFSRYYELSMQDEASFYVFSKEERETKGKLIEQLL